MMIIMMIIILMITISIIDIISAIRMNSAVGSLTYAAPEVLEAP